MKEPEAFWQNKLEA